MILNLIKKSAPFLKEVSYSFDGSYTSREDIEIFVHEIAHIATLFNVNKAKSILNEALNTNTKIEVNNLINSKLKTAKAQDRNEMRTTAVTILAMEKLGGSCFNESMHSMLGNLKTLNVKTKNKTIIFSCVEMMMDKKIIGIANSLAKMLLDLDKNLVNT